MNETPPTLPVEAAQEKLPEQLPSQEEITTAFEKLLNGKPYKVLRAKSDEKGVIVYEIETKDKAGDTLEYIYQRAEYDYQEYRDSIPYKCVRYSASIHATFYSGDMPCGGECVANYLDGTWEYIG